MKKNILLTIAYDGTDFHGWQKQPEERTVQGYLEEVLSKLLKEEVRLNGTSRTDGGVHAYGQRASFVSEINIPVEKLELVINNALAGREKGSLSISPVKIIRAEEKPMDFHARFDSKGKKYIYKINNSGEVDIFRRNYIYYVKEYLDLDKMKLAAQAFVGTHDFKAFQASGGTERQTTVRTICSLEIIQVDQGMEVHVRGDGFLYNMVRIITGTLVDVGLGKIHTEAIKEIIRSEDRSKAGHTAPACGLYLAEVYY